MKKLTVNVNGQYQDASLLTLPLEVYSSTGRLLGTGAASPTKSAEFDVEKLVQGAGESSEDWSRLYVTAKLPNGRTLQEFSELGERGGEVTFSPAAESPHEWLQWVTPFRTLGHLTGGQSSGSATPTSPISPVRRIGAVWTVLWELQDGRWVGNRTHIENEQKDKGIRQFTLRVSPSFPSLLQVGGEEVAWRLISLPPGSTVRVALTLNPREGGDSVEITLSRLHSESDLVMSYLARGAWAEAQAIAEVTNAADMLLNPSFSEPVSAIAGAYVLLKTHKLAGRLEWLNILDFHPFSADVSAILAAQECEQEDCDEKYMRRLLLRSLDAGLPIYSVGMSLLVENMGVVHLGSEESDEFQQRYLDAQTYLRARCSKSAYFAFYGKSPLEPSWTPIYGASTQEQSMPTSQALTEPAIKWLNESVAIVDVTLPEFKYPVPLEKWPKVAGEKIPVSSGAKRVNRSPRIPIEGGAGSWTTHRPYIAPRSFPSVDVRGVTTGVSGSVSSVNDSGVGGLGMGRIDLPSYSGSGGGFDFITSDLAVLQEGWAAERAFNATSIFDGDE